MGAAVILIFFASLTEQKMMQDVIGGAGNVTEKMNRSAEFFRENGLHGPIFNNYDIGGFLIFNLFPQERVFVDNRPEAYPEAFFQEEYVPMQQDNQIWENLSEKYAFSTIFFATGDVTDWGQNFLVQRIKDDKWAPVFYDDYAIIFLKRNEENKDLIARFEIPHERFRIATP
jgi:hypothetical protein